MGFGAESTEIGNRIDSMTDLIEIGRKDDGTTSQDQLEGRWYYGSHQNR